MEGFIPEVEKTFVEILKMSNRDPTSDIVACDICDKYEEKCGYGGFIIKDANEKMGKTFCCNLCFYEYVSKKGKDRIIKGREAAYRNKIGTNIVHYSVLNTQELFNTNVRNYRQAFDSSYKTIVSHKDKKTIPVGKNENIICKKEKENLFFFL